MTHNPPPVPPFHLWPSPSGPDCPSCPTTDQTVWVGTTPTPDGAQAHRWLCRACTAEFATPATRWPVLDGPDCPVCESPATRWTGVDPDHLGDAWTCEAGHEFVLDPEGFVFVPGARNGGTC